MALLVLIVIGSTLGWLASIITRTEAPGAILRQMGVGLVAALAAGLVANQGTFLGSLSLFALGVALAASIAALVLYLGVFRQNANA